MSKMKPKICKSILFFTLVFLASAHLRAESVTFRQAIELAIKNSSALLAAKADQDRAFAGYLEYKDQFVPQVYLGSGLAYSSGFPLGAPSVFNVASTSLLYNPAAREFTRAASTEYRAARFNKAARQGDVVLDTALSYSELDKLASSFELLKQQEAASLRVEDIVNQRIQAGIESQVEGTRAKLNTARIRVKLAEMQGTIENLRLHLASLTGLPAKGFETITESIPQLPPISQDEDVATKAVNTSPIYKSALETANAKTIRASGEHKALRPSVDLVGQYALFARFNNYDQFYLKFVPNNVTIGVQIRVPFLNRGQMARAAAADAEAVKAQHDARIAKDQISAETVKFQRAVAQLNAIREVARLEYQLARSDTEAVQTKVESGTANLRDQEQARLTENEKYAALLDSTYELEKGQMQLLKATGEIETWALSSH
jgi:outer membrane protein TolC